MAANFYNSVAMFNQPAGTGSYTLGATNTINGVSAVTASITGSTIAATAIVSGNTYAVVSPGNTVWPTTNGNLTLAAGAIFTANAVGTGTGTVEALVSVAATALVAGSTYIVLSTGTTTTWPTSVYGSNTPSALAVGATFIAFGAGTGTGTAALITPLFNYSTGITFNV